MKSSVLVILFMMTLTVAALHPDIFARFEADNAMYVPNEPPPVIVPEQEDFLLPMWEHVFPDNIDKRDALPSWKRNTLFSSPVPLTVSTTPIITSPPTTTIVSTTTNSMESQDNSMDIGAAAYSGNDDFEPRNYIIYILVFVVAMLVLCIILSNINSSYFRQATTEKYRHIPMNIDYGLDSVVLEIPTNSINTSQPIYFPPPSFGKQLSIVREASQEVDM